MDYLGGEIRPMGLGWGWTDGGWQLAMCRGGEVAVGRGWDRQH